MVRSYLIVTLQVSSFRLMVYLNQIVTSAAYQHEGPISKRVTITSSLLLSAHLDHHHHHDHHRCRRRSRRRRLRFQRRHSRCHIMI